MEAFIKQKGKPFYSDMDPENLFMKLKQFREQRQAERSAESSSEEERKVNALASGADEGRDKLR